MKKKMDLRREYSCDYDSVKATGSMKNYFQIILDMTLDHQDRGKLYSPLFEKGSELQRRIEQMKISRDTLKKSKAIDVVYILAIIVTSTFLVSVVVYA